MIRIISFLILIGALALGVAWLADRPGDVVVTWQGWRIETSTMVLGAALLAAMVVLALLFSLLRAILRSPYVLRRHLHRRRGERAYEAISRGLIAVGAGDLGAARKHTAEAKRMAPTEARKIIQRSSRSISRCTVTMIARSTRPLVPERLISAPATRALRAGS